MEKNNIRNTYSDSERPAYLGFNKLFKSKFFYFAAAFISLIIASNNYSKQSDSDKKITVRPTQTAGIFNSEDTPSKESSGKDDQDKLVEMAVTHLGVKYTTAGKKPSTGFDCSGFTSFVYKQIGVEIPPSSITQSEFGDEVELEDAEKGDLIFFKSPTPGNNNIGHVGIVVSNSHNQISFIHSSSSRGVVIDNLDSKHYQSRYREVRRVL